MTSAIRALLAVLAIGIGLALMAVGYGKPQWMFQVAVVVGVALHQRTGSGLQRTGSGLYKCIKFSETIEYAIMQA